MSRRYSKLSDHWLFLSLIIVISLLCHLEWRVVPRLSFNFFPLAVLLIIYLGYKGGRWLGLVAGLVSGVPVFLYSFIYGPYSFKDSLLWSANPFEFMENYIFVTGFSLEAVLLTAFLGYLTGVFFDRLEAQLASRDAGLETFIPIAALDSYVGRFGLLVEKLWADSWAKRREESKSEQSKGIQPESESTASSTSAHRIGLIAKKGTMFGNAVVVASILALSTTFAGIPLFPSVFLEIHFIPFMAAAVFLIYFAFQSGGRSPMVLVLFVFVVSISLYIASFEVEREFGRMVRVSPSLAGPGALGGILIMTWWAARIGEMYRDPARWSVIKEIFTIRDTSKKEAMPNDTVVFILTLLVVGFSFSLRDVYYFSYKPSLALFVAICLLTQHFNGKSLSNRVLVITGICAFISLDYFDAYESAGGGLFSWNIFLAEHDMLSVFAFAFFALLASTLNLDNPRTCRTACYGFFFVSILINVLSGRPWVPFTLYAKMGRNVSLTVNLLLQIGFLEIAWRVMYASARRMGAKRPD